MNTLWKAIKKRHWDVRAERERRALTLAAAVVLPILVYLLLWQPAHSAVKKLQASVPAMRTQSVQLAIQSAEVARVRHLPKPAVLDANALKQAVEAAAIRHQLREALSTLDTQEPNAVRITLAAVAFEQWLRWVRELQQEQNIRAESVAVVALPQTGMVKISATLTNGGAP